MAPTQIKSVLISSSKLSTGVSEASKKPHPDVSSNVSDKARWLQCAVRNQTEFDINTTSSHFDSGRYEDHPGWVGAFSLATFTACNGDNTVMTGVSGGQGYRIAIDGENVFEFSVGFTNPWMGTYKAGVIKGNDAKGGYEAATQDGGSIESDSYKAKDQDGKEFTFKLSVSATASQRPSFVVTETRWY